MRHIVFCLRHALAMAHTVQPKNPLVDTQILILTPRGSERQYAVDLLVHHPLVPLSCQELQSRGTLDGVEVVSARTPIVNFTRV